MFRPILAKLVLQTGARWAMIVGGDGVLLETDNLSFRSEAEGLAAVFAACFRFCCKATSDGDLGNLRSSLLATEQGKILFQSLTDEYFLVVMLDAEAHAGKTFFEITRVTDPLAQELSFSTSS
jgi:predicted regulator of Ras-like GTPase activity (Roadblock/LC7/MglB family)